MQYKVELIIETTDKDSLMSVIGKAIEDKRCQGFQIREGVSKRQYDKTVNKYLNMMRGDNIPFTESLKQAEQMANNDYYILPSSSTSHE